MKEEKKAVPECGFPPGVTFIDGGYCAISDDSISILAFGFLHSAAT